MAETYWDPANLLQITDSYSAVEIQCVGHAKTRYNARCRWTMCGSDAAAVLAKLTKMAASPPSHVTQQHLEDLAKMCLCRDYHASQWNQAAQRWKSVVARAVEHHERLVAGCPSADGAQSEAEGLKDLRTERQKCLAMLDIRDDNTTLPAALAAHLARSAGTQERLEDNVTELQGDLATAHVVLTLSEDRLREAEGELYRGRLRETELTDECLATVQRIRESGRASTARLTKILRTLEIANNDRGRLERLVTLLQGEVAASNRRLANEKSKAVAMGEARIDLERRLAEANEDTARVSRALAKESRISRELSEAQNALQRRMSETSRELASALSLLKEEKARNQEFQSRQADFDRRLEEAYAIGDQLLANEREKASSLKQANSNLEQRLHELRVSSERELHQERAKAKVLSDVRDELKRRLDEVRASQAAEAFQARQEREALSVESEKAAGKIRRADAALGEAQRALRRLGGERSALAKDLEQLRTDYQALQSSNEGLAASNLTLQHRVTALEAALSRRWRARLGTFVDKLRTSNSNTRFFAKLPRGHPQANHPNQPNPTTSTAA